MNWSWNNEQHELPFKKFIRSTLLHHFKSLDANYPYVRLVGPDSEQGYELPDETIDRYGWLIRFCTPVIRYGSRPEENTHHWYLVGNALNDELKQVFSDAGLENVFMAYWDSEIATKCLDHHGFVYDYNRPAVNVLTSHFTLDYVAQCKQPDWAKFEEGISRYAALIYLRHSDD